MLRENIRTFACGRKIAGSDQIAESYISTFLMSTSHQMGITASMGIQSRLVKVVVVEDMDVRKMERKSMWRSVEETL